MILIINITIFVGQKEKNNEDRRKVTDVSWRHKFSTMGPFTQDWLVSVMYCFEMSSPFNFTDNYGSPPHPFLSWVGQKWTWTLCIGFVEEANKAGQEAGDVNPNPISSTWTNSLKAPKPY